MSSRCFLCHPQHQRLATNSRTAANQAVACPMNRSLALILLILLGIVLLHSLYAFYRGRFGEAMIMYPLLVVCYLAFIGHGKQKLKTGDDRQQNKEHHDDDQPRPLR